MDKPMNRIKEVLEEKGIKQTWLAEKLGKSFCIVNSYVCNRRQPSLEVNPEKPDVPLNKNDAFQKVQKRRVQEKR